MDDLSDKNMSDEDQESIDFEGGQADNLNEARNGERQHQNSNIPVNSTVNVKKRN